MATTPGLRPLGLGEILEAGIKLYLRHWRVLMACVVWVVLPLQIVSVLITLAVAPEQLDVTSTETAGDEDAVLASQAVIALLSLQVLIFATAASFKAIADAYAGREPTARRSLAFALQRPPALIWLAIVATGALVLAFFALVIPAVWLSVVWSLAVPALLFERLGALDALRRSFRLVEGRWWRLFLTLLVGGLLVGFFGVILQAVLLAVPAALADGSDAVNAVSVIVAGTIGGVLTTPFTSAIVALLYFDQRVRKEGFDLRSLAEGLGVEPLPEPATQLGGWAPPAAPPEPASPAEPPAQPSEEPSEEASEEPSPAPEERGWQPPQAPSWQPPQAPSWPPEAPRGGPGGL